MRIVKLKGGLGNQMFQYAFANLIEEKTGDTVRLDYSSYDALGNDMVRVPRITKFQISLNAASEEELQSLLKFRHTGDSLSFFYKVGVFAEKTINHDYVFEANRGYIEPDTILDKHYFDGYWQSHRYVSQIWSKLAKEFVPNYEMSDATKETIASMKQQSSVFVGVRKGDYAETKYDAQHFGIFKSSYYRNAMAYIAKNVVAPVFYVFSNDIIWCKENLDWGKHNVIYREPEQQTSDFEELILISSCKHAVIVNSTYHWWGAQLIRNPDKIVMCPQKWFFDDKPIDIIPDNWVRCNSL